MTRKTRSSTPRHLLQVTAANGNGGGYAITLSDPAKTICLKPVDRRVVRQKGHGFSIIAEKPNPIPQLEVGSLVLAHFTDTEENNLSASNWGALPSPVKWHEVFLTEVDMDRFKGKRMNFGRIKGEILGVVLERGRLVVTYWKGRDGSQEIAFSLTESTLVRNGSGLKIAGVKTGSRIGELSIFTPQS